MEINESSIIRTFLGDRMNELEECKKFLRFMSEHPELLLENLVLLYLQEPAAPRYLIHKGIAEFRGMEDLPPVSALTVHLTGRRIDTARKVYFCLPDDRADKELAVDNTLEQVFHRIGYRLERVQGDVPELDIDYEQMTVRIPSCMPKEEYVGSLTEWLCDYLYRCYRDTGAAVTIREDVYRKYYRTALLFITKTYLGLPNAYLSQSFVKYFPDLGNGSQAEEQVEFTPFYVKYSLLHMLWTEFNQMLDGRHFTVFESEFIRSSKGRIFENFTKAPSLKVPFSAFTCRYIDIGNTPFDFNVVHMYPPLSLSRDIVKPKGVK